MKTRHDDSTRTVAGPAAQPQSFASGRYSVRRLIGEGGQKIVYLARDTELDRDVAIAVLKTEGLDETRVARVKREAQAMARLEAHSQIVAIYDIGEHEGRPYTVCEYVPGGDLEQALRKAGGALPIERALAIARDVCTALALTHARTLLHRDIKPSNIWLAADGSAKLGDFGLAVAEGRARITQAGTVLGTAVYMAPEQALGGDVDARTDLYSFGCVLYELVTGRPPFVGDDTIAIVSQHINTAPVAPSWHQRNLPQALERLTLWLLAKSPEERPKSAEEVLAALEAIAEGPQEAAPREEANPLDRLAGGVFVGREHELGELRSSLDEALSGHGRLVLLTGEPGIGKTRLAEELATYAQVRGAQVVWGRCYEGEGAPAYWPWVQAIRSYVYERAPETLLSELGTGAADIAQIVSEVRERLPGLPPPAPLEPEQARFRLFDSITTLLKNASRAKALVLVLDDLHWADKPSLLLLQFLARELRDARFFVLGSYRDVEFGRQHPLSHTLAELAREQLSQRVVLRGLTEHDVARFIEMTAGMEPPAGLVATVYRETEGNPFFVKEVVSLLASERRFEDVSSAASWTVAIPESVREVVGRRLDQLSEACNRVLTVASVVGREFNLDVLERVSDLTGDQLLDVVEEAVAARIVQEIPRGPRRCRFSHALIRETLYEELTTTRRVRLHRRVAEALEQLYGAKPESHLAELAYHFCEAAHGGGDVEKAVDYAQRAGERATSLCVYEEAAGHFERALETLDIKASADEAQRCDLVQALGEAYWRVGEPDKAKRAFLDAAGIARVLGAESLLARAALGLGDAWTTFGAEDESMVDLLEEAFGALQADDSAIRAKVTACLARALSRLAPSERGVLLSGEAVAMARRVGDPGALAYALVCRHWNLPEPEALEERFAVATEILGLAQEAGDNEMALQGHSWRIDDLLQAGDFSTAQAEFQTAATLARQVRHSFYLWVETMFRAMRGMLEGRLDEAEHLVQQALGLGQRVGAQTALPVFGAQMFLLRWEQGRIQELEPVFSNSVEAYPTVAAFRSARALLYAELDRPEEARRDLELQAADEFSGLHRDRAWLTAVTCLAQVCAFLADKTRAEILYNILQPYDGQCVVLLAAIYTGPVSHYLGLLAATMSRWDDAERHFTDAAAKNAEIGARPRLARTQHDYAKTLLDRGGPGDQERAVALLSQALDTAQVLGMAALTDRIHALQPQGVDGTGT